MCQVPAYMKSELYYTVLHSLSFIHTLSLSLSRSPFLSLSLSVSLSLRSFDTSLELYDMPAWSIKLVPHF